MNTRSTFVFLFMLTIALCSPNVLPPPASTAAKEQPNMLEIVGASVDGGAQANVALPQLVHSIYQAILSLREQATQKICPMYVTAQYQLTFLHDASSVLTANVKQGGCMTVALSQNDIRSADPHFLALLEQTHALKKAHPTPSTPDGFGPNDLQNAYALPSTTAGKGRTVAIIDANDDPKAAADLAVYRSTFHLRACTTANGCFRKVNQRGSANPPKADPIWATEIALDLDMVSAICPNCHILLVEADNASLNNLGTAVNTAIHLGATVVSNSYGSREKLADATTMAHYYNHPGAILTASSGDSGYGVQLPAAFKSIIAVGGTTLSRTNNTRRWNESAWGGSGSGCSQYISKPTWQKDTLCRYRIVTDVSAVADPDTGVAIYNSYESYDNINWSTSGGTSASSPIIAGIYALAGNATKVDGAYLYRHAANLNDITTGNNGTCHPIQLCTAGKGYDGPTGLGTPKGIGAF